MQIDRLFQIVQILLHKEKVTAKELSERFGVSSRTIYRDIDTLSINGVPVYTTKGKGGGIRLMENYTMDRSVISEEEKNNILLGLETLKAIQAEDVDTSLSKFSALFRQNHQNWIRVDFSHWGNDPKERQKFDDIKNALTSFHMLEFDYNDSFGRSSHRKVVPLQLLFKEKAWYLVAHCMYKDALRFFKLMRVVQVQLLDQTFDPGDYHFEEDPLVDAPPLEGERIKFWLSKEVRYRVYDDFYREQVEELEDGNFLVDYYGREDNWLYGFILGYGEHIQVIEPLTLRHTIKDKIEAMLEQYL